MSLKKRSHIPPRFPASRRLSRATRRSVEEWRLVTGSSGPVTKPASSIS